MGSFGGRLLLRLVLLGVALVGVIVYEKFFEKPRFNYTAAATTPKGWSRVEVPAGHYSVALPNDLFVADATRADYKDHLETVKRVLSPLAHEFTQAAVRRDPTKLEAVAYDRKDDRLTQVFLGTVHSETATNDSDESIEKFQSSIMKGDGELVWDKAETFQTPVGKAFRWKARTKPDEDGVVVGQVITGFVDKHDLYLIQVLCTPDSPKTLELSNAITNNYRIVKH